MASAAPSTSTIPSSSTFSFTAPFPPSPTSSLAKQRRVSLALPSSPRIFPAWSFRDDTGLGVHSGDPEDDTPTATYTQEKRGKMRRIATDELRTDGETSTSPQPHGCPSLPEKKPRKKWTMEETQMLVAGCNKVRGVVGWPVHRSLLLFPGSGASATGSLSSTTPTSGLTVVHLSTSKTGTFLMLWLSSPKSTLKRCVRHISFSLIWASGPVATMKPCIYAFLHGWLT